MQDLQRRAAREQALDKRQRERTDEALLTLAELVAAHGCQPERVALRTLRVEIHRLRRKVETA
jgi:hypothetical protein